MPIAARTVTPRRPAAQKFSNSSKARFSSACSIPRMSRVSSSSRFKEKADMCPLRSSFCRNCSGSVGNTASCSSWTKCNREWDAPGSGGPVNTPGSNRTTFGGNPVCIAAALATMDLIESEYMENASRMGDYLFGRLADWTKNFKIVGDVRGRGLMIGIEIVRDPRTKEKAADLRNAIVDLAFHKGLLVLGAGENTIRLSPPLLIDQEQADFAARTLEDCFREAEKKI